MVADTVRSAELRHEVPLAVPDEFLYVERNGTRHIVVGSMEIPRLEEIGGLELHPLEEFGVDELRRSGSSYGEISDELMVRAVRALGVERATVPVTFPLLIADRLRAAGVELTPDREFFDRRRRVKTQAEVAGIRRAQTAAEAGMGAARDLLRRASASSTGALAVDGQALTSERLKSAIAAAFLDNGATADDFVVSHGAQSAIGHHMGDGPLQAGEPVVIDLWPRDNESACSADMTRTFVVGEIPPEVAGWHRLCKEALDRSHELARPGVTGKELYEAACDIFEPAGHKTQAGHAGRRAVVVGLLAVQPPRADRLPGRRGPGSARGE